MIFNKDFIWGAAASAFQIEGASQEDGKGLSVWDMMCRKKGAIRDNQNGDVACGHYHRYKEDVALMKDIGLKAYRLSISWPRILPDGVGRINPKGLDFYKSLIDELLANDITPHVTLFHWDYPYELYCKGGWLNRQSSDWFAEYTKVVVEHLSDRVTNWVTLNEPQCFIGLGHQDGTHAPGDKLGQAQILLAAHNTLLAHGKSVQVIRAYSAHKCSVGYAPMVEVCVPLTGQHRDIEAARTAMFSIEAKTCWNNTWWMDPVLLGQYPLDGLALYGKDMPAVRPEDMKIIHQPLDFLGLNIYQGREIESDPEGRPREVARPLGYPTTSFGWRIIPQVLYWGPRFASERYHTPLMITENGMANSDWVAQDGKVHDPQRIDFVKSYLRQLRKAVTDGVDVRGYFLWSIMDNFEWAEGFQQRFGIVYVDFNTQKRIFKDSAYWYKELIASNDVRLLAEGSMHTRTLNV